MNNNLFTNALFIFQEIIIVTRNFKQLQIIIKGNDPKSRSIVTLLHNKKQGTILYRLKGTGIPCMRCMMHPTQDTSHMETTRVKQD